MKSRCFRIGEFCSPELNALKLELDEQFSARYIVTCGLDDVGSSALELIRKCGDRAVGQRSTIKPPPLLAEELRKAVVDRIGPNIETSGSVIYPPGGCMGWHSNSDREGWRLYISYVQIGMRSFFRWCSDDGEIITDYDEAGFNFRAFRIGGKDDLFWHCIYADVWRFSQGFRFLLGEQPPWR